MPEDMQGLLDDMRAKNIKLQDQVNTWENQWKGFQKHQETHWTVNIPKPDLAMGKSWFTVIGRLMTTDMEKLYRFYIVVCIICTMITAVSIVYKNTRRY